MINRFRTIVQITALVLLHTSWSAQAQVKWFCAPVLSCHSCALSWFACPIGILTRFSSLQVFPFLALGMVFLLAALFGRLLCGWICPFGFLQDLLNKIPVKKHELPAWTGYIKYGVLLIPVLLTPLLLGSETQWLFCKVCPATALQSTIPSLLGGGSFQATTWVILGALVIFLGLALKSKRGFCRAVCPIGAMMAPFNRISFWRVKPSTENCTSCGKCDRSCPAGITPADKISEQQDPSSAPDCIVCHECRDVCPVRKSEKKG